MHGPKCKLSNFCTVGRRIQEVNILGGLILPVWGTIEKALSKQVIWFPMLASEFEVYLILSLCGENTTEYFMYATGLMRWGNG